MSDMQVRDVMVPPDGLRASGRPIDTIASFGDTAHSRFPAIGDMEPTSSASLLARTCCGSSPAKFDLPRDAAPAVFVPESSASTCCCCGIPGEPQPHGHRRRRIMAAWPGW